MTVAFTYVPSNNIGIVRSLIQDTNIGLLINRVIDSISAVRYINISGISLDTNELIGNHIYPDINSETSFKIVSNTASTIKVRGDLSSFDISGTSAVISEAIFSDSEITNFINQAADGNVKLAAAIALRALASDQAKLAKKFKRSGIGAIEIEKRDIKQILDIAQSYENSYKDEPASVINSMETGIQERNDDYETNDFSLIGNDLSEYNQV